MFFGGNWTDLSFETSLEGVSWQQAEKKNGDLNTIADLTFHAFYCVEAILNVFEGKPVQANDRYSYDTPSFKVQVNGKN